MAHRRYRLRPVPAPGARGRLADPDLSFQAADPETADAVLDWFASVATGDELTVTVSGTEPVLIDALRRAGYRDAGGPFFVRMTRPAAGVAEPVLPEGFRARSLAGPEDAGPRAAVHRTAFAGSRVTEESYRQVMAAWPYRPELDWVIEASDGSFASFATTWLDEVHQVGLFEPVGTDPRYRRSGLARAVCAYALRALAEAGAREVVVWPRGDADWPIPKRLYASLGFAEGPRTRTYTRRV
jgi:GNAT superfamily N-acetyltransferase